MYACRASKSWYLLKQKISKTSTFLIEKLLEKRYYLYWKDLCISTRTQHLRITIVKQKVLHIRASRTLLERPICELEDVGQAWVQFQLCKTSHRYWRNFIRNLNKEHRVTQIKLNLIICIPISVRNVSYTNAIKLI